jgi:GntR family transcriptional regulator
LEIEPDSRLPLHVQIENALESTIANGTWRPGKRLPSEDALIERFAVSRTTIRTAIQSLIARGLLQIHRGRGTFVVQPRIVQELTGLTGFIEDESLGPDPFVQILDRRVVAASETVSRQLALLRGASLIRIQRLRSVDGVPLSFDETYLPVEVEDSFTAADMGRQSISSLEQKYADGLLEAEYRLAAVSAHGTVARALGIDAESPIFLIERTTYADDFQPIYYQRLYHRGDQVRFTTRLTRRQSASPRDKGA